MPLVIEAYSSSARTRPNVNRYTSPIFMTKEYLGEFGRLGQFTMKIFVREVELGYRQASRGIRFSRALRSVELMLALEWEATGSNHQWLQ